VTEVADVAAIRWTNPPDLYEGMPPGIIFWSCRHKPRRRGPVRGEFG
jgi:hypothetical protein